MKPSNKKNDNSNKSSNLKSNKPKMNNEMQNLIDEEDNQNNNQIYDLEININSILGFVNGWDIIFGKDGEERYENAKINSAKIYSTIGIKNKGKSFLLSKIAQRDLPNGYSVTTKGLSICFPDINDIALFDSVGFESPLLEIDGEEYRLKSGNPEEDKKVYSTLENLDKEIKLLKKTTKNAAQIRTKESQYFKIRNEFRRKIEYKEKQLNDLTNERKITDFFLQRFIIENAHVILLVVGKLSMEDQLFLNKLTTLIKEENQKFLQRIIVIHNLKAMEEIHVVQNYINNTLKKSLTFTLEENNEDLILENAKKDYNKTLFYEIDENDEKKEQKGIVHLIMAKYGTKAGDYYNDVAIDYIRKVGDTVINTEEFDVIEKLKEYFCKASTTILKLENPDEKIDIKPEDIKLINENGKQKLKLFYDKKIKLETFYFNDLTDTFGEPRFDPDSYIYSNDPDYVIVYLYCPGKTQIIDVDVSFDNNENAASVTVKGIREKVNYETRGRKFGSGNFIKKIYLDKFNKKNGEINKNVIVEPPENGYIKIKFERNKKEN